MRDTIDPNATIRTVIDSLHDSDKYVRTVFGTMHPVWKAQGNAFVRIGITGEGKVPYHKVVFDDANGVEQLHGSFDGEVKDEKYQVHQNTWSTSRMSYEEVRDLLGEIRGFEKN